MKKVILVTGCSSGLGKELTQILAQKKHLVYAGIRNDEERKTLTSIWKKEYGTLFPVKLDVTDDKNCKEVVADIIKENKTIDVLINNAGYTLAGPIEHFSAKDFQALLDTNLIGAFRLIQEVLPFMKQYKSGHIINITSLNGLVALPNFSLYCSSKFALEGLTRALMHELNKDNIKITNIEPGAMKGEVENKKKKKLPHRPAREKFWIINVLMPIISVKDVARQIAEIVETKSPPASVLIGRDAQITTLLQRFLPIGFWNKLVSRVWNS